MASALKNLSSYDDSTIPAADEMIFGIVVAEWNAQITHALYEGCYDTLLKHGAKAENIFTMQVPGSFELPAGARLLVGKHNPDAVICLGCVIKGETNHNEYINQAVANGLVNLSIASGRPFIFGVLTPNDEQQALDRAGGKYGNKGVEAAVTAIRMAALKRGDKEGKRKIGF
ncbi:MAG TPA: 6,7-dimethyl-8-ribityllumazine synthase [Saprospiraceae bacterium]|nr:6,7-dimethyl-8-ribityllumazine synthase [Saprospiraceae bacterium]